jgi:hypothetical protein
MRDRRRPSHPKIAEDSPEGERARRDMGEAIVASQTSVYLTDGTALGAIYDPSPICWADGTPPQQHSIRDYRPTTQPGARAPHAWLPEGRSTLDLYGRGFVLLRLGDDAPNEAALASAFARRGVPLAVAAIADPNIRELYERRFVLVRPDGHVAWRGNAIPADPLAVADVVRGAAPQQT